MVLKKLLLFILVLTILLTSCSWTDGGRIHYKDKRILSRIERTYGRYKGYKCKANINIISSEGNTMYVIEETYYKPDRYKLKILEPKESKGIIILNMDDKIFIEHPSINQSISLVTIKSINKQLLIGSFFEDLYRAKRLANEKINNTECLVFEYRFLDGNVFRESAKVWLNKKNLNPYKLEIFDSNGGLKLEITYDNFRFFKTARKPLFWINIFGR